MASVEYICVPRIGLITDQVFLVSINNIVFSFSKISNIQANIEYESFTEGGNNEYPHFFRKQKQQPDTLILEKGVITTDSKNDNLDLLIEGQYINMLTIMVIEDFSIQKTFGFDRGMITKLTFSDLDAMGRGLFIEKLEIAHTGLKKFRYI